MKRYKIAAILIFIHGFVEICVGLGFIPLWLSDFDTSAMGQYFVFIVPYLQENLHLMSILGMIYGSVRLVGAVGLWKNRMVGIRHFCNKLHYNNGVDDIYATSRNYGRNIFL